MRALLGFGTILVVAAAGGWLARGETAAAVESSTTTLRVGDRIRVQDVPLGCRIARLEQLGGRVVIDCRRAGPLTGSYGTLLSAREAAVVRFSSKRTAKIVAVATHEAGVRRCR